MATDTADKIVAVIESLLPSTDPRPYSHRIGPVGAHSALYLTGATDEEAEAACASANAARPAGCVALRPFIVTPL